MKAELEKYFFELVNSPNLTNPPHCIIGSGKENPTFLSRNDADGERGIWDQEELYGKWRVSFLKGTYNLKFKFLSPLKGGGQMIVETGTFINQQRITQGGITELEMSNVTFPDITCDLIPFYRVNDKKILPFLVEIERVN